MTTLEEGQEARSLKDTDRYLIVSTDTHTGPYVRTDLRPYCEERYLPELDRYCDALDAYVNQNQGSRLPVTIPDDPEYQEARYRQAHIPGIVDPHARLRDMNEDGIAAEVIYHGALNEQPVPFSSTSLLSWSPPDFAHLEVIGVHIYNRWLADFVSVEAPRRVGTAHIPISDVDAAVREVEWARSAGLSAVNIPAPRRDLLPYTDPSWEPLWAACEANEMVMNTHAGGGDWYPYEGPASTALFFMEYAFFARRAMPMLILSGVFERHPNLKYVLTEQASDWVPEVKADLRSTYYSWLGHSLRESLPRDPAEYFNDHIFVGASFMAHHEVELALREGIEHHFMWGTDYPHQEGTWPHTLESLRHSFHDVAPAKVQQLLGDNAISVYGLDREYLSNVAAKIGPTVKDVAVEPAPVPLIKKDLAFRTIGKFA